MGANASKMLEEPWREFDWKERQDLQKKIQNFRPSRDDVKHLRILLYGPVCSGKSSFINSMKTALHGISAIPAPVNASNDNTKSFTVEYKTHKIRSERTTDKIFPFVLCDTMGLEPGHGVQVDDLILVMKGHVRDGYQFNPTSPLKDTNSKFYNPNPALDDRVHLLVCALPADTSEVHPAIIQKIQRIKIKARDLNIPHVALLTRTDLIHKEVKKDVRNVFRMQIILEKIREYSVRMGFDENHFFPVRNYCTQYLDGKEDMDKLLLTTLKYMLDYADDFIQTL